MCAFERPRVCARACVGSSVRLIAGAMRVWAYSKEIAEYRQFYTDSSSSDIMSLVQGGIISTSLWCKVYLGLLTIATYAVWTTYSM